MTAMFDLSGRVALVTGGNRGIGRAIAHALSEAGANIVVAARDEAATAAVVAEIEGKGRAAAGVRCDVRNADDIVAAVAAVEQRFGRLDILVNDAGITGGATQPAETPEAVWDAVLDTNLKATFRCCQAAYALLAASQHGKVINVASLYALSGTPAFAPYSASKGGVIQLTKSLALAWARDGIQVNAIIPGFIATEMTARGRADERTFETIVGRMPARRFGEPEEIGGAAVFLASAASSFMTGASIVLDGGYSIT